MFHKSNWFCDFNPTTFARLNPQGDEIPAQGIGLRLSPIELGYSMASYQPEGLSRIEHPAEIADPASNLWRISTQQLT